jgi:hypothetical protein
VTVGIVAPLSRHVSNVLMWDAMLLGDVRMFRRMLTYGADARGANPRASWTPLTAVINVGAHDLVEPLLRHGADLNLPGSRRIRRSLLP